jgi:hypothetical protein
MSAVLIWGNVASRLSQEWIQASKAERLPHPANSPDPAPSDFFLFEYFKKQYLTPIVRAGQTS